MDSNEDELEARSIADRLQVDWSELTARARKNAEAIEGWNVLKEARYVEFMLVEKEAAKADSDRRKAGVHANLNWHPQPGS